MAGVEGVQCLLELGDRPSAWGLISVNRSDNFKCDPPLSMEDGFDDDTG